MAVDEGDDRILPISGSPQLIVPIVVKMSEMHFKIYSFPKGWGEKKVTAHSVPEVNRKLCGEYGARGEELSVLSRSISSEFRKSRLSLPIHSDSLSTDSYDSLKNTELQIPTFITYFCVSTRGMLTLVHQVAEQH